jgi:hypothetical protein
LGIKYRNQFDLVNGKMNMTKKWIWPKNEYDQKMNMTNTKK